MSTRGKARERASSRKVTPPSPSYMSNDQFASYLADLRNNRVARPGGARPLPSSSSSSRRDSGRLSVGSRVSFGGAGGPAVSNNASGSGSLASPAISDSFSIHHSHQRSQSDAPAVRAAPSVTGRPSIGSQSISGSITSRYSTVSGRGRDYYPDKAAAQRAPPPLRPDEVVPTDTYMECGQRWMEKEEVVSLRHALEDMDLKTQMKTLGKQAQIPATATPSPVDSDDHRIYNAALSEAAELVWQHQNGIKPPEPGAPYQYKQHLRKNSYAHARTASVGRYGNDIEPSGLARDPASRSVSGSSASSCEGLGSRRSRYSYGSNRVVSGGSSTSSARQSLDQPRESVAMTAAAPAPASAASGSVRSKAYAGLAGGPRPMMSSSAAAANSRNGGRRRSSMKRNISGEIEKPFSGDQIYEEPETATPEKKSKTTEAASVLQAKAESNINGKDAATGTGSGISKLVSRFEIHRNPPSQSRNPHYTTNTALPQQQQQQQKKNSVAAPPDVPRKNGVEIRSEDIRQATSMKLKDRNPKLPTPSYVSDSPGRPIVSFDANWKAPVDEAATDGKLDAREKNCYSGSRNSETNGLTNHQAPTPLSVTPAANLRSTPAFSSQQHRQQQHLRYEQPPQQQPQTRHLYQQPPVIQVNNNRAEANYTPSIPTIAVTEEPTPSTSRTPSSMPIPTIAVSEEPPTRQQEPPIPTIVLPGDDDEPLAATPDIPIIVTPEDKKATASPRAAPPPAINAPTARTRPLPTPGSAASSAPRGHWSRAQLHHRPPPSSTGSITGSRATARCHECRYPIEGRFVALAGLPGMGGNGSERFHPQCFRCYACGTSLEALEISPEPDEFRNARLHRIERRARGELLEENPGETMGEDGDDRLRFYCHLDWHELFAPRCKHCTTPIVGEHVVALGAHWHVGHFFCAECGDPFGPGATHIEKDGYAWCIACQTRRTERRAPKCRACGKAAIGQYVQALGAEWHEECFRCAVCSDGFVDGQIFPREGAGGLMQVVCTMCRQRELKA